MLREVPLYRGRKDESVDKVPTTPARKPESRFQHTSKSQVEASCDNPRTGKTGKGGSLELLDQPH